MKGRKLLKCQEISRNSDQRSEEIQIYAMKLFGYKLVLIDSSFIPKEGEKNKVPKDGLRYLTVHSLLSGEKLAGPLSPSSKAFNLTSPYGYCSKASIQTSISSYDLNLSFVLNPGRIPEGGSAAGVFARATFDPISNSLSPRAPTLTKTFNDSTEILKFRIKKNRDGSFSKWIKYKNKDTTTNQDVYRIYIEPSHGPSKVVSTTNKEGIDTGVELLFTIDFILFFTPRSIDKGYQIFFGNYSFKSQRIILFSHLFYEESSMSVKRIICFPSINFVQILFEDSPENGSNKHLVNFVLDPSDFRKRYHSKVEVDKGTTDIEASLSDDKNFIQTVLIKQKIANLSEERLVVVTRVNDFSLKINNKNLLEGNNLFEVEAMDSYNQKASTKISINLLPPTAPKSKKVAQKLKMRITTRISQIC